ncbi:MCE family protein [Streptomyces sp. NBC_00388]|uniref:MCE family protein n=1 Tax=Streptomyces sp. NBC_00388 TaxID=2975735 RepID=UPI002E1E848E
MSRTADSRTPRPSRSRTGVAVAVVLAIGCTVTLGGCAAPSFSGIESLPLPGGADLGSHPYEITADFADVLNLVPQAAVKVNDVAVGRVSRITLSPGNWSARVTMRVNGKVRLPRNAYAHLEQSSLLGEKFIQLTAPEKDASADRLTDGQTIPISRTNRNPEVEEVFGALSLLLNGGGVQQLRTISTELNKTLGGREPQIRSTLQSVNTLVTSLDGHKSDITEALDGVNRLSATLATRKQEIGKALTGLSPGLKVLEKQRGSLITMLKALDTLSGVAVDTVNKSKADMVADLKALAPTLQQLADSGKDLPDSLQVLLTYPFTDEVLRGVKGDYLNVYLDVTAVPGTQIIPPITLTGGGSQSGDTAAKKKQGAAGAPPLPLPSLTAPSTPSAPSTSSVPSAPSTEGGH